MSRVEVDSSSEDEGDYQTTNVTLGYAATEPTGDEISRIGGYPAWLDEAYPPPAALANCKVCNGLTSLLLQLHADLQRHFPQDDRRLHVFCCRKKACSKKPGSIRAFREVRKPEKKVAKKVEPTEQEQPSETAKQGLGNALFGGIAPQANTAPSNPFSMSNGQQSQSANPFSSLPPLSSLAAKPPQQLAPSEPPSETFASKLKISDPPSKKPEPTTQDPWLPLTDFPPPFTKYYLDAAAEELDPDLTSQDPSTSSSSKIKFDVDDSSASAFDKDTFESSLDKTFQKFSDRIAQNPEQVLRYEFEGQPLLYSGTDNVSTRFIVPHNKAGAIRGMPRCESCGAQRVFEMQLVPGLIYELEKTEPMNLDEGMEWGTIIVGTCVNNCGEAGAITFKEEWVGVQWEERLAKR